MATVLSLLLLPLVANAAIAATPTSFSLKPTAGTTWNIQLLTVPPPSAANNPEYSVWDFDLFNAPNDTIKAFKAKNHPVICYFSAGSWENWRDDAKDFPKAALGKTLDGWENERWLDTRNGDVRKIMAKRIALAKAKGCDGVDPDNIDGYGNPTGFKLTKADGIDFVKFLSNTAHQNGLSYGLKNGGDIIPSVVSYSEWVINEQCVQYEECDQYQPFIDANKPVFNIEYTEEEPAPAAFVKKSCSYPDAKGFSTLIKHLNLTSWTTTCSGCTTPDDNAIASVCNSTVPVPSPTTVPSNDSGKITPSVTTAFAAFLLIQLGIFCKLF